MKDLYVATLERLKSLNGAKPESDDLVALQKKIEDLVEGKASDLGLGPLNRDLARLAEMIESGDARPAAALQGGVDKSCKQLQTRLAQWQELQSGITKVNGELQKKGLGTLPEMKVPEAVRCEE
jgi:hypothetical protein